MKRKANYKEQSKASREKYRRRLRKIQKLSTADMPTACKLKTRSGILDLYREDGSMATIVITRKRAH